MPNGLRGSSLRVPGGPGACVERDGLKGTVCATASWAGERYRAYGLCQYSELISPDAPLHPYLVFRPRLYIIFPPPPYRGCNFPALETHRLFPVRDELFRMKAICKVFGLFWS